jgi:transposase-like protein
MTKPYSVAFKQRMVQRLTGKNPVSAMQLSRETGIRQQNLSRWLEEARSLPHVGADDPKERGACCGGRQLRDAGGFRRLVFVRALVPRVQSTSRAGMRRAPGTRRMDPQPRIVSSARRLRTQLALAHRSAPNG